MTEQETPTVLGRMLSAGISEDRGLAHLRAGRVRVDGVLVSDAKHVALEGSRIVVTDS